MTLRRKKNINWRNSTMPWISEHLHAVIFSKDAKTFFPDHYYQTRKDTAGSKRSSRKTGKTGPVWRMSSDRTVKTIKPHGNKMLQNTSAHTALFLQCHPPNGFNMILGSHKIASCSNDRQPVTVVYRHEVNLPVLVHPNDTSSTRGSWKKASDHKISQDQ